MRLGLREANQQFSRAIRAVRAGKEIVLTERGQAIAVIRPVKHHDPQEGALQAMVDDGLIRRAGRNGPMPSPHWRPVKTQGRTMSQTVIDDRDDGA